MVTIDGCEREGGREGGRERRREGEAGKKRDREEKGERGKKERERCGRLRMLETWTIRRDD